MNEHPTKPDKFLERMLLMDASKPHTFREIGDFCGVSYQAVEQLYYKAIRKCWRQLWRDKQALEL